MVRVTVLPSHSFPRPSQPSGRDNCVHGGAVDVSGIVVYNQAAMHIPPNVNINCGIYRIVNRRNGKFYIGSSKNLKKRRATHFRDLKKGVHHSEHLQRAWNKETDKSVFDFQVFIYCGELYLIGLEQGCIDNMKPDYNANLVASNPPVHLGNKNPMRINPENSYFFGRPAWNRGLPSEKQPTFGRQGSMLGRKGEFHPAFGRPSWNKGKPMSEEHKKALRNSIAAKPKTKHVAAKLTETQVIEILNSNETLDYLAGKYGVLNETISKILRNKTWKYIQREKIWTVTELRQRGWTVEKRKRTSDQVRGSNHRDAKLTEAQVIEILKTSGRTVDVARKFGVTPQIIYSIRKGNTWKHVPRHNFNSLAESYFPLDWPSEGASDHNANALLNGYLL